MELYECDMDSVDEMLPYFRISSNAIYPFQKKTDGKTCFLRLSPVEEKKLDDVKSEIRLIEWLIKKGFPAMKPVPMKDGKLFDQIHTEWGIYNVSCFEKVSGSSLEEAEGTIQIVRGYGKTLGELHALMKEYPYPNQRRDHKMLLEEIGERIQKYCASEIVKKEYENVCVELDSLPLTSSDYGIIHYDFEPDNVFYDKKEEMFSVIDFDDAINCWYALDVARALDGLDEIVEADSIEEAITGFLEGYASATTFTVEQQRSMMLMRRLVRLQEYTTLLHVLSEEVEDMPEWMSSLIQRLKYKLSYLEESMNTGD